MSFHDQAGATRTCASCGRRFGWRRKWADSWAQIRYCSERCRRRRLRPVDLALEKAIRELLAARSGSICPSEAAQRVAQDGWRPLMEPSRSAARRMASRGEVAFLQGGRRIDPSAARGPVRLARGPSFGRGAAA